MRKLSLAVLLVSVVAFPLAGYSGQEIRDIVIASEEWEGRTNADGTGLYWEIFKAVYGPAGIEIKPLIRSYAGAVNMVRSGQADAVVAAYKDEVEGALFPRHNFDTDVVTVVYRKGLIGKLEGQKSLANRSVAWIKGYSFDKYLKVPVKRMEFDDRETILRIIDSGKADFFLDAEVDVDALLSQDGLDASKYEKAALMYLHLYLAFYDSPKGRQLLRMFDDKFGAMLEAGKIDELFARWEMKYIRGTD